MRVALMMRLITLIGLSRTRQLTLTITLILTLDPNLSPFLNTSYTVRTVNKRTAKNNDVKP